MKIFSSSFKKNFKRKHRLVRGAHGVQRDWQLMLIFFVVIALLLAGFSGYIFWKINEGEIFSVQVDSAYSDELIDRKLFEEVVEKLDQRYTKRIELGVQKISVPDPSL
mgnify:CR=1 FL=1